MNQDSQSSPLLSEEQKQIAVNSQPFFDALPSSALIIGSNQSLERLSVEKNQSIREEIGIKTGKKGKRGGQELKNINRGHWSTEQNKKYHWFLEIHYKHFVNRHMRRTDKIFKTMQIFIGTRQAEQCRSHHQKMQKKYLNFISIISNLREIHYATLDTALMQHQIESNQIQIVDKLATIQQLKAYKKGDDEGEDLPLKKVISTKSPKQQKALQKIDPVQPQEKLQLADNAEQNKQRQMEENGEEINMFQQSRNHFGELIMYHEKEDNSCIFQSMFQH